MTTKGRPLIMHLFRIFALFSVLAAVLVATSGQAHADCSNGTSCTGPIGKIYAYATGAHVLIDPAGDTSQLSGTCTDDTDQFIRLDLSTNTGRAAYQLLLASYLAGQSVRVRAVSGTGGFCYVGWVSNPI